MQFNPPSAIRAALYILTAVGTPVVAYLFAKHHIGELEVTLWSAEVAVVNAMAALNVTNNKIVRSTPQIIEPTQPVVGKQGTL